MPSGTRLGHSHAVLRLAASVDLRIPNADETSLCVARCAEMISLKLLMSVSLVAAASTSVVAMKWEKRVLLVSAPGAEDPMLNDQRRIIAGWRSGAAERDLTVVEVVGSFVVGASDSAAMLRKRYGLPTGAFAVVLIGKDGGAKLRMTRPISALTLEQTIDAMPMRRSGQR